ncbi:MAG TPA: WD40 repeat domain-containing protein, partial [Pseudonocardiaceae bacterium]
GYGLPAQLIPAIAAGTGVDSTAPSDRDVAATLDSVSRYVTVLPSPDGAAYRLFHDSLAEHLRAHPFAGRPANGQPALFAALLDSVPCMASGERDWRRATWYVRRHILRYATTPDEINTVLLDTGYLLTEAPEVRSAIAELDSQLANAAAAVVDLAATWPRPLTESQRSALAIEAARTRCDRLVESLVSDTGEGLRPIFVTARATPTGSSGGTHVGAELTAITDTVVARYTVAPALQVRGQWPRPAGLNVIAVGAHRGAAEIATQDTDWRLVFRYAQDPDDVTDSLALSAPVTAVTRTDDAFVAASWDGALYEWAGQWRSVPPLMEHALDELTYVPMSIGVGRLVARSADSLALLARTSTGYRTVGRTISGTGRHTVVEGHRQTMVIFCVDNGETFLIYPADGVARRGARRRRPQDVTAIVTVPAQPQPWIVLGDAGGELWSWPFGGDEWQHLGNCDGPVTALTSYQHGDTSFVGSGTEHGEIAIWDLATCTADRTRIDSPVRFLVSQSTKTNVTDVQIAVATGFGGLVLAELVDGFTVRTHRVPLDTDGAVEVADIHLDRPATGFSLPQHLGWTVLVVGHGSGRRSVWHPVTGRPVTGADPSPVIETSDSKHVVLLGDRLVSVRGTRSGTLRLAFDRPDDDEWSISAHTGEVTALATWQHGDTALVVSCGTDRAIRIWDLAGRRMLAEAWLPVPAGQVTVLPDTSAGGYRIVAVTDNDIVVLTGEPKGTG